MNDEHRNVVLEILKLYTSVLVNQLKGFSELTKFKLNGVYNINSKMEL